MLKRLLHASPGPGASAVSVIGACRQLSSYHKKKRNVEEMVRVDHAGEVAAVRICEYQLMWMSPLSDAAPIVKEILRDELVHRQVMIELAKRHQVATTQLDPLFKLGAMLMGGATAILGKEAMMCCHAAVEVTIYQHYNDQLRELEQSELNDVHPISPEDAAELKYLKDIIVKFRDEEKHHQELGEQNGSAHAPAYPVLYNGIRYACQLGVAMAKKL